LSHALIAFGRGELLGVGLGASVEKLFYLPEAHTDFLLAVIAEELGFVGVLVVILLFGLLIQRAFAIGRQAVALERSVLRAGGAGHRGLAGRAGLHQHGRKYGSAADQGIDPAT
jgi:cell division protein FtsW (lipid II flippase)